MLGSGQPPSGGDLAVLRDSLENEKFPRSAKMRTKLPIRHGDGDFQEGFLTGGN